MMTEGIIQEVITKWKEKYKSFTPIDTPRMLENLERDLIAEIKKEIHTGWYISGNITREYILQILIGEDKP